MIMQDKLLKVTYDSAVVLVATQELSGLFVLSSHHTMWRGFAAAMKEVGIEALRAEHIRLGHLNARAIKEMVEKRMADGLRLEKVDNLDLQCTYCAAGKATKVPYPGVKNIVEHVANLDVCNEMHSDQMGPITPPSHYGNKYIIEFIDGASRLAFVFGMKSLTETTERYRDMRALIKTQIGKNIKMLISDGHRTFTCNEMNIML